MHEPPSSHRRCRRGPARRRRPPSAQDHARRPMVAPVRCLRHARLHRHQPGIAVDAHIGAITGRVDARYGKYFGVEGELSGGVNNDNTTVGGLTKASCRARTRSMASAICRCRPNADLFARIGYGDQREVQRPGRLTPTPPSSLELRRRRPVLLQRPRTASAPNTPARTPPDISRRTPTPCAV